MIVAYCNKIFELKCVTGILPVIRDKIMDSHEIIGLSDFLSTIVHIVEPLISDTGDWDRPSTEVLYWHHLKPNFDTREFVIIRLRDFLFFFYIVKIVI